MVQSGRAAGAICIWAIRFCPTSCMKCSSVSERPSSVSEYSTRGGNLRVDVAANQPASSVPRCSVNMRCVAVGSASAFD